MNPALTPAAMGATIAAAEVTTAAAVAVAVAVVVASQKQWCGRWQRRILCNNGGDEGNGGQWGKSSLHVTAVFDCNSPTVHVRFH